MKASNVKTNVKVSPLRSVFEVEVDGPGVLDYDTFTFSVSTDGDVTINDNVFSSKTEAAKVLKAMSDFLAKK